MSRVLLQSLHFLQTIAYLTKPVGKWYTIGNMRKGGFPLAKIPLLSAAPVKTALCGRHSRRANDAEHHIYADLYALLHPLLGLLGNHGLRHPAVWFLLSVPKPARRTDLDPGGNAGADCLHHAESDSLDGSGAVLSAAAGMAGADATLDRQIVPSPGRSVHPGRRHRHSVSHGRAHLLAGGAWKRCPGVCCPVCYPESGRRPVDFADAAPAGFRHAAPCPAGLDG